MSTARALKRILARIEDIETQVGEEMELEAIDTNIQLLEDEWKEYRELEVVIGDSEKHEAIQSSVDKSYFKTKRALVQLKRQHEAESSKRIHNASIDDLMANQQSFLQEVSMLNRRESEVRLPRINIPSFSGKYSEFPSFKDLFEASIDSNEKISKVHKFQYLKGLLKDEAAALVRHIAVTEANYSEAWEKIKARYDKKRLVVSNLIKQFVDQPVIAKASAKALHQMADVSDEVLRGLKVLGTEAETRDPWLIHILVNKLDSVTKQAWADETAEENFPTMEQFFRFLNKKSDCLDTIGINKASVITTNNRVKALHTTSEEPICIKCSGSHYLSKCDQFLSLSNFERRGYVAEKKLCFNCLSPSHLANVCRSRYRCGKCHKKHHLTLHTDEVPSHVSVHTEEVKGSASSTSRSSVNVSTAVCSTDVLANTTQLRSFQSLLPTAMVNVPDRFGNLHKCRVLLDSGSQASFITEACMQRLKLNRTRAHITITGLASGKITTRGAASILAKSLHSPLNGIQIDALILSQLPSRLPSVCFKIRDCDFLRDLELADPDYNVAGPIDILIGADKFFHIIEDGRRTNSNNTIMAQRTLFGWVVSGITNNSNIERSEAVQANICTLNLNVDHDIDDSLRRFFEQEEVPDAEIVSPEDAECERHYISTYKRRSDGRYVVEIPFKKDAARLGNSLNGARKRFFALERKLQANKLLKDEYSKFIREYIDLGYLELIDDKNIDDSNSFYLPHHCVLKETSETTKLRVVFDGSAKSLSEVSLNDTMQVGPTIQPSLWSILMRFRNHKIALIGDIEKMYNQVLVTEKHTQFQRILWRSEETDELKHYKLNTVTFGLASSSFLAIRTLHQIAYDNELEFPNIVPYILNDFYVDDFISGADTLAEAILIKEQVTQVLQSGGFKLRKWKSNVANVVAATEENEISTFEDASQEAKILGLQWNAADDAFLFNLTLENESLLPTKRRIISEYSRVFDPLGWLSPSILIMKILFQSLWLKKLGWDDKLPDDITNVYSKIRNELKLLENIRIKRYIPQRCDAKIELHGFSDASEKAYGAVVYCRTVDENGEIHVNLMASKTKVAPIKQVSLPRLELCAAHLLTKLLTLVKETIRNPVECYAWTDSTIVLMWLSSHPVRWKTYVANRTAQILDKLPRRFWNHVRSDDNPADHASRGVFPAKLVHLTQWWYGPRWLQEKEFIPSAVEEGESPEGLEEERKKCKLYVCSSEVPDDEGIINQLLQKTSSYTKLIRVVAYIFRFLKNTRSSKDARLAHFLSVNELRAARDIIIRHIQRGAFMTEIDDLQKGVAIKKSSGLLALAPFLDANGILRVGGRLRLSDCQYDYKHPIILPKGHIFSQMIIKFLHVQNLHPGLSLTFHLIRQQFWVIGGRNTIRKMMKGCLVCAKNNAKTSKQLMGDLPISRVKAARPFSSCGVDYAGPMQLASKRGRGARLTKGYIALFVCMVTKAIHLEPVSDLTTEAFLAALKRFAARRGAPSHIYSDNGSNFIGAKRKLNEVHKLITNTNHNNIVAENLANLDIQWHFIPPASPHFGGLWEAAVKSVKTHLAKSTANTHLTFEEMATLLYQIEAILNSRPLCATSDNDESCDILTPAHFLIGSANFYLPEEDFNENIPAGRLGRWQFIQQRVQGFWKRFKAEYLHQLQQRIKWQRPEQNFEVGDIVLIKEDNLPTYKWALGRITQLHPDDRGLVRVVTLKTAAATLKRPIVKLCKLPVADG